MSNRRDREAKDFENAPTFEGKTEALLRSGRLYNLYDSAKWDSPTRTTKAAGRKPRSKDHR